MKYFKLPDLGEGLQEAEIVKWHIKAGDTVKADQIVVSVETAKAIVDVPTPQSGVIATLFGETGDLIHTGEPLLEYAGEEQEDTGTVVGVMQTTAVVAEEERFIIGSAKRTAAGTLMATPAIRSLASRLDVDLARITGTGRHGIITSQDVENAARVTEERGASQPLKGVRRTMAKNMARSHAEVARVTVSEDVDLHNWKKLEDPTMRLVKAMAYACKQEPYLNAWYDGEHQSVRLIERVDLGIAVDTPDGLFVPVLRDITNRSIKDLKKGLDRLRDDIKSRKIPPKEMTGATITLSNFGTIAGRYANPVVVPPTVAILGAGCIRNEVVAHEGKVLIHPVMPLSLSFDHRVITGGEATRFLRAVMDSLKQS